MSNTKFFAPVTITIVVAVSDSLLTANMILICNDISIMFLELLHSVGVYSNYQYLIV